jgi:hypothetical protein
MKTAFVVLGVVVMAALVFALGLREEWWHLDGFVPRLGRRRMTDEEIGAMLALRVNRLPSGAPR